jgi:hypothetical protein
VVLDVYVLTIVVTVLAILCVVGGLSGQELRNMRKQSSIVRRPHTFRGGGHWCAACEQIHRMIRRGRRQVQDATARGTRGRPAQQARALSYWSTVLDMNWHPVDKAEYCALAFADGNPSFMDTETIGIAQMPT